MAALSPPPRSAERRVSIAGLVLLALALAATIRLGRVTARAVADEKPRPDALEYEEAARGILRGDGYALRIDGRRYPPRYPPALSWLVAGAMAATGTTAPGAGAPVVLGSALLSVVAAFLLGNRAGGTGCAAIAALVVALSPLHVRWSRAIMADVPSTAACALVGAWCLARAGRRVGAMGDLALGVATGLLSLLRLANLALVLPVLVFAATAAPPPPSRPGERFARVLRTAGGIALGVSPLAAHQAARFGSPWRTGYDLWHGVAFSTGFATRPGFGATGPDANPVFYAKALAGAGALYPWPIAILVAIGILSALRSGGPARRLAGFAALLATALGMLYVPFFWQWDRFLLPLLPFLAALAGFGARTLAAWFGRAIPAALLLCGLTLVAHSPSAWRPIEDTSTESEWLRAIDAALPSDAVVLLRTDPFHFRELLRGGRDAWSAADPGRVWVPIGPSAHRFELALWKIAPLDEPPGTGEGGRGVPPAGDGIWTRDLLPIGLDADASRRAIADLLAEGRPVYVATSPRDFEVPEVKPFGEMIRTAFLLEEVTSLGGNWRLWRVAGPRQATRAEARR